ncbi:uncharacterized protein LOC135348484 isoform X3 [Halichondria panicea]|uniref:uncharacterized protein LOC135348484 isoform X3 n=1 Tax=Halichondria panicea TaxID=6063 RepID=UPI00312BBEEB
MVFGHKSSSQYLVTASETHLQVWDLLSCSVLWCVKTRVCSMVSDPLSLTAVFVPSGNDPHIVIVGAWLLCGCMVFGHKSSSQYLVTASETHLQVWDLVSCLVYLIDPLNWLYINLYARGKCWGACSYPLSQFIQQRFYGTPQVEQHFQTITLSTQCPSPRPPPNALPLSPVPPVTVTTSAGSKGHLDEDKSWSRVRSEDKELMS